MGEARRFWGTLILLAIVGLVLYIFVPGQQAPLQMLGWEGLTMGTTYRVQVTGESLDEELVQEVKTRVEVELKLINDSMSTWLKDSLISEFNRSPVGESFQVDAHFRRVMEVARQAHEQTEAAFDPTLGPLIRLWGFDVATPEEEPSEEEIQQALQLLGFSKVIQVEPDGGFSRSAEGVELNLSAIAKGYAVDRIAALLEQAGFTNLYVEIGGEVVCRGVNQLHSSWRIGIQTPREDSLDSALQVVRLENRALATSGDYRNVRRSADGRVHHILDPRTGRPTTHGLASVSVLAEDCVRADALATGLFVIGTERGLELVASLEGVEALFINREGEDFRIYMTPGFRDALVRLP